MIDFTVLGGYLGAGKTTLLNHMLHNNEDHRFALLINDFGDINIDALLIQSASDTQINLTNGCVCCTLSDGFFEAIDTLQQLDPPPDHIILEASGVADVCNLSQYGYGKGLHLAGVIVLADAETVRQKAEDKYVAQTVRRQLQSADLIVLNKIDLCSMEQINNIRAWLNDLTKGTPVVSAMYGRVPLEVLFSTEPPGEPRPAEPLPRQGPHEAYLSWSFQSQNTVPRARLEEFLQALPESVIRAKGLFEQADGHALELQVVGRRKDLQEQAAVPQMPSAIIVIGLQGQLHKPELDTLAARFMLNNPHRETQ